MGMKIDGIATNGQLDSSGEILNVAGHDISDLQTGRAVINWEHGKSADDIIGSVIYAKKILSEEDCDNDRQYMYWELCNKVPFVYIIGELYDDEGHPGAVAAAAMIRYCAKRKEPLLVGFSIEGVTLERDGNILKQSVGRRVAMTLRPANKSCIAGLLDDDTMREVMHKAEGDILENKSLYQIDSIIVDDSGDKNDKIIINMAKSVRDAIEEFRKTIAINNTSLIPSVDAIKNQSYIIKPELRRRLITILSQWDRKKPLREVLKAALPELSEQYIDYFSDLAEKVLVKPNKK